MVTKEIEIVVHADKAEKSLEDVGKSLKDVGKESKSTSKQVNDGLEKTEKSGKKASKGVGLVSKGFKMLGTAMKAAGIGLIVSLVAALGVALSKNQKVMDAINTVFETAGIVLSQVATSLVNVYESVAKSSENFNGLGKVLGGLLTISITPLKLAFFAIKLAIQEGQLAWEKSFFGGNDKDKIVELNIGIIETKNAIVETGKEAIQSGKDIVANFADAISEVGDIGTKVGEELSKVSVKSAFEQAKVNVQLKNTAQLAVAQQQLLVEKYDILAEKQRQIRDEERNTIDERIKANNALSEVLEKQQKAMLMGAEAQIAAANAEVQKNNTIENQVALTDALANKQGVLAQIEGFRSEQLINDLGLKREQIELDNSIADSEKERQLARLDFEIELAKTESDKNIKLQERLDLENEIILADLERKKALFQQGTQARVDAEQQFLDAKQLIDFKQRKLDESLASGEKKLAQDVADAKASIADRASNLLIQIGGKAAKIGKAIAVARTIQSSIEGTQEAFKTASSSPLNAIIPGYNFIQAGLAAGFGALKVRQIIASPEMSAGGGGSQGGQAGPQSAPAPSFNLVEGTDTNQIAQSINGLNSNPVKAFVVATEVTSAQQAERNKVVTSSI
jgi:hypothetical protein